MLTTFSGTKTGMESSERDSADSEVGSGAMWLLFSFSTTVSRPTPFGEDTTLFTSLLKAEKVELTVEDSLLVVVNDVPFREVVLEYKVINERMNE